MFGCDVRNEVVLKETGCVLVATKLNIALGTKGRISGNSDAQQLAVVNEGLLGQVGVDLDLENLRFNASVTLNIVDESTLGVATIARIRKTSSNRTLLFYTHLKPMFFAKPLSTRSSSACHVSWKGTLTVKAMRQLTDAHIPEETNILG